MAGKNPVIISILNAKGGVGKTTTAANLGAGLANAGYRVLLIDIDLQSNLTQSLIGMLDTNEPNIAEALLREEGFEDIIRETGTPNLHIVPAGDTLMGIDIDLVNKTARELILKNCIQQTKGISDYDVILIDNPPYVSLSTINSLTASSHYLIPVSCEYLPMIGIRLLNTRIEEIRKKLNRGLQLFGVLLTMYDKRESITAQIESVIRKQLCSKVFDTVIRVNTRFKSTPIQQETIFQFEDDDTGKGSQDYASLTAEVINRLKAEGELMQNIRMVSNG